MTVFVFHGTGSTFANAVFSSQVNAEKWIGLHGLTGLLTEYFVDAPAFDRQVAEGKIVIDTRPIQGTRQSDIPFAQQFVDGERHYHYFYGVGEESPDFLDSMERWHRDHGTPHK